MKMPLTASKFSLIFLIILLVSCSSGGGGSDGDTAGLCDGSCAHQALSADEVSSIVSQAVRAAKAIGGKATVAITDRVGNILTVYQMVAANNVTVINGNIGSSGGLEGTSVPAHLAAISKAGTAAFLSSQGNAFSTRTASQIIQEHFDPGQRNAPGGPLFGVQFSQLLCSDQKSSIGPKPLPLGLSADPGGLPLYKGGDLVGGIGIEIDGIYTFDRNIGDTDNSIEEFVAVAATKGFEAPDGIRAEKITVGGQALRFSDLSSEEVESAIAEEEVPELGAGSFISAPRGGVPFGIGESGVVETVRAGVPAAVLAGRFGTRGGSGITAVEVDALLDSALVTASRLRAAIRRPLNTGARVSIFIVDQNGIPLGFIRSQDAPVFGIDVALQKARTAAFFSSADAGALLSQAGFGGYISSAAALGVNFDGTHAFSARAIGNLSRPFFPDGIDGNQPGPFSKPFPGSWSPFNTGLQLDLSLGAIASPLSGGNPSSCTFTRRLGNGIQIFSGAVPLYRGNTLIGAIGISGDGIFQDDMVAFYGASRQGLDSAGHNNIGDPTLGFNAPPEIRSDTIAINFPDTRLRYVSCPESPFISGGDSNACEGL